MPKIFPALSAILLLPVLVSAQPFMNPLHVPDTLSGPTYNLTLAPSSVAYLPGTPTVTYGYNGDYLGPTLILNRGDFVQMHVTNLLPDTTTTHWHGMHVAPEDDGGPHTRIFPDSTWSPDFEVLDEATTHWYHPHLHGLTARHVYQGASGVIIVRDDHEATLNLPRTYGVDDFPLLIQDKAFDDNNQFVFAALADTMMVNGTLSPFLDVPAQMVRLRLLNGSNQRVYNLGVPPQVSAQMIGSDGGLLRQPLPSGRFLLAPGERVEIVLDLSGMVGDVFRMVAFNSEVPPGLSGGPGGPGGGPGNPLDAVDFELLEFRVGPPTPNPVTNISQNLNSWVDLDEADAARVRVKDMTEHATMTGFYYINDSPFDHHHVNDTIILGDVEVWELNNPSDVAHPFHIHDIQFFVIEYNGNLPPPHLRGRKDVVLLQPGDSVRIIARFDDFADPNVPYMYHCHNLFHEDLGMMGQFLVIEDSTTGITQRLETAGGLTVFPNPAQDVLNIRLKGWEEEMITAKVVNMHGHLVRFRQDAVSHFKRLSLNGLKPGSYVLQVRGNKKLATVKFVVER